MISEIREKIADGLYEFSRHAVDQSLLRNITLEEFRESIENGIVIEDYPDDKYWPSCLILGFSSAGRALHIQCTYPAREILKIITLYEPDEDSWIDFRERRPESRG